MKRPEQILQIAVFDVLKPLMIAQQYREFVAFSVRNEISVGGKKGQIVGKIARAMGLMSGVTDTIFCFPKREGVHPVENYRYVQSPKAVFVEFKALKTLKTKDVDPESLLSDSQKFFKRIIEFLGFEHHIIAAQNPQEAVNQALKILKENGVKI